VEEVIGVCKRCYREFKSVRPEAKYCGLDCYREILKNHQINTPSHSTGLRIIRWMQHLVHFLLLVIGIFFTTLIAALVSNVVFWVMVAVLFVFLIMQLGDL